MSQNAAAALALVVVATTLVAILPAAAMWVEPQEQREERRHRQQERRQREQERRQRARRDRAERQRSGVATPRRRLTDLGRSPGWHPDPWAEDGPGPPKQRWWDGWDGGWTQRTQWLPGWYRDPDGSGWLRWWDGEHWADKYDRPPISNGASTPRDTGWNGVISAAFAACWGHARMCTSARLAAARPLEGTGRASTAVIATPPSDTTPRMTRKGQCGKWRKGAVTPVEKSGAARSAEASRQVCQSC